MLIKSSDVNEGYVPFSWDIPEFYNMGVDVCDRWAAVDPNRLAITDVDPHQHPTYYSFGDIKKLSNQLANALLARGLSSDGDYPDRVGILLPQCVETAVSHIAVLKMGCISIPLFTLFGRDALLHRLRDSGAKVLITNDEGIEKVSSIIHELPELKVLISIDSATDVNEKFLDICAEHSNVFSPKQTRADAPALLIYTSGTTGNPKGALHAHRVLLGHLPGVEVSHDFIPHDNDCFWTPADWAWIGGLLDVLMPSLHHGVSVVAYRFPKFDGRQAIALMKRFDVRNVFLPPTVLKMMKSMPEGEFDDLQLRSVASGGETLGAELIEWGRRVFGVTINEFYGQTECNMIVSSCAALEPASPGLMGRAVPGHNVKIIDSNTGQVVSDGVEGEIAVLSPDPVMFIEYWNNAEATTNKYVQGVEGSWLLTGDRGVRESSGKFRFVGREDDVIASSGYRIGPAEIEDCLVSHESVQMAGVVGKPDKLRGTIVVAYIKLNEGIEPTDDLQEELVRWVKIRLSAHEYPRELTFISELPMTTTGKIIRATLRERALEELDDSSAIRS